MDWNALLGDHLKVIEFIRTEMRESVDRVAQLLVERIDAGGKILICGNGGSAADAQHFACELVNQFLIKGSRPWPALALTTDSSILTSVSNDYEAALVFSKQVEAFGQPGDVLIGISTSGNSANVVKAVEAATERGLDTIGLLGGDGGALQTLVDHPLTVSASSHVPRIQEGHLVLIHALCEQVEYDLHQRDSKKK